MAFIFNIYITRSQDERKYFYDLISFIKENNASNLKIIHLVFRYNQVVKNLKFHNTKINANIYTFNPYVVKNSVIYNLNDIINLFKTNKQIDKSIFMYTGHSNGMYLCKSKIRPFRIEDFCEIVNTVLNGKKADLIIYDCCLCGNINCLSVNYDYTKYVIASTSYQSYESMLMTKAIYKEGKIDIAFCKNIINDVIDLEIHQTDTYKSNFVLYELNDSFLQFMNIVLMYKDTFKDKGNYVIDLPIYKDLECCLKNINFDYSTFVKYQRLDKNECKNYKKRGKGSNTPIPSKILIILKRPIRENLHTKGDLFLRNFTSSVNTSGFIK